MTLMFFYDWYFKNKSIFDEFLWRPTGTWLIFASWPEFKPIYCFFFRFISSIWPLPRVGREADLLEFIELTEEAREGLDGIISPNSGVESRFSSDSSTFNKSIYKFDKYSDLNV